MPKYTPRRLAAAAAVAAAYVALSLLSSALGLAFGPIQCRFSEALALLPFFLPEAVPGLFIGCLLTNLMSPVGPLDMVLGPLATLLAALWTARMPGRLLAPLPPILCNGLGVGALLSWYQAGVSPSFPALFAWNAVTVAAGEAVACYGLGLPLLSALSRIAALSPRRP